MSARYVPKHTKTTKVVTPFSEQPSEEKEKPSTSPPADAPASLKRVSEAATGGTSSPPADTLASSAQAPSPSRPVKPSSPPADAPASSAGAQKPPVTIEQLLVFAVERQPQLATERSARAAAYNKPAGGAQSPQDTAPRRPPATTSLTQAAVSPATAPLRQAPLGPAITAPLNQVAIQPRRVATASDAITSDVSDTELAHAIEAASRAVHKRPDLALPPLRPVVQPEVTADKVLARMQRRRWPILIALSLFLILVSGTITYIVLYNQAMQRETNRTSGYRLLDEAIALVQEGDLEVIALDEAIKTEITAEDLARRRVILEKVPTTTKTLTSALEAAQAAQPLLTSSEDQAFARHVLDAAANRLDMLSSGAVLLDNDIKAMNCAQLFGLAWDLLVRADEDMRSATKTAQSGNYYDVRAAIDLNTTVLEVLNQASELLGQAQAAFEAADFSAVSSYLILKKESVELAISSDQALLDANLDAAYTHNSAFAQKDAEVVAAAARIPADPLSLIISTYDRVISADKQLFDSARANVADADVFIREYLGVETQTGVQ